MSDFLLGIDYAILKFLNLTISHPVLDQLWLALTDLHKIKAVTFGVLPLMLFWAIYRFRARAIYSILTIAAAVALADALAYRVIKPSFQRLRPTQNIEISHWHRPVGDAHGLSFPSNHAANCFAGAFVLSHFFPQRRKYFYTFATLVALSRVSLGVHYPSDILGGALFGTICGWIVSRWDKISWRVPRKL